MFQGASLSTLQPVSTQASSNAYATYGRFDAAPGHTYYVRVSGPFNPVVSVGVGIRDITTGPLNDAFAQATPFLPGDVSHTGALRGSTTEVDEPDHGVSGEITPGSIWYTWTATSSGTATFDTAGSNSVVAVAVYTGASVQALTRITASTGDTGEPGSSAVKLQAVAGVQYRVAIVPIGDADSTEIQLNLNRGERHDKFTASRVLSGDRGRIAESAFQASREPGEPSHAGNSTAGSVWYSWTAPSTSIFAFDTSGSVLDTNLGVYTSRAVEELVGSPVAPMSRAGHTAEWSSQRSQVERTASLSPARPRQRASTCCAGAQSTTT